MNHVESGYGTFLGVVNPAEEMKKPRNFKVLAKIEAPYYVDSEDAKLVTQYYFPNEVITGKYVTDNEQLMLTEEGNLMVEVVSTQKWRGKEYTTPLYLDSAFLEETTEEITEGKGKGFRTFFGRVSQNFKDLDRNHKIFILVFLGLIVYALFRKCK
jgi:hypothetical protein